MKSLRLPICALLLVAAGACSRTQQQETAGEEAAEQHNIVYGINADNYRTETGEVGSGETLGKILNGFGVSPLTIDRLDKASKDIFPLRNIRAGHKYTAFIHEDSLYAPHLDYLVYERNVAEYVVFGFHDDSVSVRTGEKQFTVRRTKKSATINSSLWGAIMEQELPYALAAEMEDIYQWTVDFFGIQKGDNFTVIYDERFIDDSVSVGIGRIWGAKFCQGGKEYYAIPFRQGGKIRYWEYDGASLRKQMLKAPLKYSRISSKFTYARKHPIYKVYRPHTGVDYAAPKGTPVHAVADGVVTFKGWGGGGGNTLKIKHAGNLMTGYLHLSGYAKGISKGSRVSQGQLIGYVGSTGASTGPHLDYRIWKNGTPIDPLKVPQEPAEPIAKENRATFEFVRDRIAAELNGEVKDEERITQLDSLVIPQAPAASAPAGETSAGETTEAVERRETEKPGTEHKAPETKTEEVPAEKGSASAAESNSPATKGHAAAAEGSTPTTKGNTPAVEENAAVAEGSVSAVEKSSPVAETPGSAESGTAKTSGCGEAINERFVRFLRRHHVLTLATVAEGVPYCSNAFYCYDKERNLLVFSSDLATRHAQEMERNPRIAASVVLETKIVGRVQGLQLCGTAARADETARRAYLKRFPYAALAELTLWAIRPDYMKLTDNTLGFGKKLIWNDKLESSS